MRLFAPHNPLLPGVNCCLGAIGQMQFAQNITDMAFDRANTDHQIFRYFLIGVPSGNQGYHFQFPLGQLGKEIAPR